MGIFNLFIKKRPLEYTEDFEKDINSVMDFFKGMGKDVKDIHELLVKSKKLRSSERSEYDAEKQIRLLKDEIIAWDNFLEKYVMFDRDVDVTSARIKKISEVLREEANTMRLHKEIRDIVNKKDEWVFNW